MATTRHSSRSVMVLHALFILLLAMPGMVLGAETRLVSLSPSLTELVYALGFGDRLVGRSSACDFPPDAKAVPEVGGFGVPNLEALLRIKPTHVLVTDLENRGLLDRMKQHHIEPLFLPCESWDQLMQAATNIAAAAGQPDMGTAWVADMQARRKDVEQRVAEAMQGRDRPTVYVEVWSDPLTTAGASSFLNEMISMAGGTNIGAALDLSYANVNGEWVISRNPDAIVLAYMTAPGTAPLAAFASRPGWRTITAVKHNRICWEIPPELLTRPGPRMLDGVTALAGWLRRTQVVPVPGDP
jgi:iron complex transport system substrate-binding protein